MNVHAGQFAWLFAVCALTGCGGSDSGDSSGGTGPGGNGAGANGGAAGAAGAAGAGSGGAAGTANGGTAGLEAEGTRFWQDQEGDALCPTEGRPEGDQRPPPGGGGNEIIHLVMTEMNFGDGGPTPTGDATSWKGVGFNLDQSCNAASWPPGALSGDQVAACPLLKDRACKNDFQNVFDGDLCRDNALGTLFAIASLSPIVGEPFRLNGADWNCALRQGSMSVVFGISEYNGNLNDDQVRVDLYSSVGLTEPVAWHCRTGPGNSNPLDTGWQQQPEVPRTKTFQLAERDIAPGFPQENDLPPFSKWADTSAYVRAGWLIAQLPPNMELWFNGFSAETTGMRLLVNNGILAARLEQASDGRWQFSTATLGGSVKPGDMVTSFRETGFCENLCDSYSTTVGYLNQTVDMRSSTNDPDPTASCDALSFGIEFSAKQYDKFKVVSVPAPPDVSGGKCGTPRNPDVPKPGCTCPPVGQTGECQ
ncbi:MAG: hypothetical protein R3B07_11520 [Polyangiaceae bacterium]